MALFVDSSPVVDAPCRLSRVKVNWSQGPEKWNPKVPKQGLPATLMRPGLRDDSIHRPYPNLLLTLLRPSIILPLSQRSNIIDPVATVAAFAIRSFPRSSAAVAQDYTTLPSSAPSTPLLFGNNNININRAKHRIPPCFVHYFPKKAP